MPSPYTPRTVNVAERVQPFLVLLGKQDLRHEDIAAVSGVSKRTVTAILSGERRRINSSTADALLEADYWPAIRARQVPWVDATASRRRLQALARFGGWSCKDVSRVSGINGSVLHLVRSGTRKQVRRATELAIERAYERLWDLRSVDEKAVWVQRYAQRQGWEPPMAWDDDRIGDPSVGPNGIDEAVV